MSTTKAIPVTETFVSLEGEGTHVGVPTLFIRLFGCNLTCPGFHNSLGRSVDEQALATKLDPEFVSPSGCDTIYAWHPLFKDTRKFLTVEEMVALITYHVAKGIRRISFTGGEPLMHQESIVLVLDELYRTLNYLGVLINIETNGTRPLNPRIARGGYFNLPIRLTVSPKLSNSGESADRRRINPSVMQATHLRNLVTFKFVISDQASVDEALQLADGSGLERKHVYFMPMGSTVEQINNVRDFVVAACLTHNISYTPRLHCYLFDNKKGT